MQLTDGCIPFLLYYTLQLQKARYKTERGLQNLGNKNREISTQNNIDDKHHLRQRVSESDTTVGKISQPHCSVFCYSHNYVIFLFPPCYFCACMCASVCPCLGAPASVEVQIEQGWITTAQAKLYPAF